MTNVFDLIEEFYTQDEEWNSVLQQACAEDFLRYKTWQGAKTASLSRFGIILRFFVFTLAIPRTFSVICRARILLTAWAGAAAMFPASRQRRVTSHISWMLCRSFMHI